MRIWIKNPLAILAAGAERGIVVEGAEIVECVGRGQSPAIPPDTTFNASRHVVLPGLINAHHHFYQTLTRAHRADRVMVAGRWRVIDGQPEDVDLPALIAKHKAAARAFA